jgi:oligopeptide/dipeptide ABC transporter ATP-binding protein
VSAPFLEAPLLEVRGLTKHFPVERRALFERGRHRLHAVDDVSFALPKGSTLGLVGESGCGKSTTARLILRLIEPTAGQVLLDGEDLLAAGGEDLRRRRRDMQIVFQDPLSSLNPRMTVGVNVAEPLRFHGIGTHRERLDRARHMLEVVGLKDDAFERYPHEFSGGQCQRVAIARALILQPRLVIFDEPVSALDVSIRAQILQLLLELQHEFHLTYIFISHDLSVVKRVCDLTAVMYLGRIVELGASEQLYREPLHPYTQALLQAIPVPDPRAKRAADLVGIEGDVPSPIDPPSGCRFHTRCPHRMPVCDQRLPALDEHRPRHRAACFLYDQALIGETPG